jgi:glutamine amidotransferase
MKVAIVDYGSGNLRSAQKAFERAAAEAQLPAEVALATTPEQVLSADRVVLPGVGAFADCLAGIERIEGMREAIEDVALARARPFLGICVGMQLLATRGLEHGVHKGLGWIPGEVKPIEPADRRLKVPHMGWNELEVVQPHPVLLPLLEAEHGRHAYFVHSYHFVPADSRHALALTHYGGIIVAAVGRDNILGFQFHPEKSQKLGLQLIAEFLRWRP